MYRTSIQLRVRYGETDRMGYAYYGNYAEYFEVARVEALRELGMSYRKMEDEGILLPVLDYYVKYIKPAYYDDLLKIVVMITEMPTARLKFEYKVYNENNDLITKANTTLVFIDSKLNKPLAAPKEFSAVLEPYFS
jgi:acyl-CoA thioester hydrolase